MLTDTNDAFIPGEYRIQLADAPWEKRACAALRRQVFCHEQRLFVDSDEDEWDPVALPIAAIACVLGMAHTVVGTVRIHPCGDGTWQGSRLAVLPEFRRMAALGTALIRHAVGSAQALGCERFVAHVQAQNVPLFQRLHWRSLQLTPLHGIPHHLMEADLSRYAPCLAPAVSLYTALRSAA